MLLSAEAQIFILSHIKNMEIRNIAIIAHVDHGKTTLTDALMKFCNMLPEGASMDSNDLEKERGITIYSKNTSVIFKGTKINIVDTPGHADFGSEVERVLRAIDAVLLLVDAVEGPMPQTRFVLKKSLELGLKPIVIINKIDKPQSDPKRVHDEVFELFMELGATDEQLNFETLYAIGRQGIAKRTLDEESTTLEPLLDFILEKVALASGDTNAPFVSQVFNLAYDNFLGRLALVRVYAGKIATGSIVVVKKPDGTSRNGRITKLMNFNGLAREEVKELVTGDIALVAGIPDIYIGETIGVDQSVEPKGAIAIDEPTISLQFLVNDSPFAGREGKFVTGRQIRERLEKELEINVGLRVDFTDETYIVSGRGELHIAILLENMRREGYELQVSQPKVIIKNVDGVKSEPFEEVIVDVPSEYSGAVIEKLTRRRASMLEMKEKDGVTRIVFEMPTRGLLGYRGQFVIDTKGEGILSARVTGFMAHAGEIKKKDVGSMVTMIAGKTAGYALWNLQERGVLYIGPATEVYEGMVLGNTSKGEEMSVNPVKGKQLTNVRASGTDEAINLVPPWTLSIERGLEVMNEDEYLEITPHNVRLRKKYLTEIDRNKAIRTK